MSLGGELGRCRPGGRGASREATSRAPPHLTSSEASPRPQLTQPWQPPRPAYLRYWIDEFIWRLVRTHWPDAADAAVGAACCTQAAGRVPGGHGSGAAESTLIGAGLVPDAGRPRGKQTPNGLWHGSAAASSRRRRPGDLNPLACRGCPAALGRLCWGARFCRSPHRLGLLESQASGIVAAIARPAQEKSGTLAESPAWRHFGCRSSWAPAEVAGAGAASTSQCQSRWWVPESFHKSLHLPLLLYFK